jgi:16S rRNA C1402 N4-methylase RsmH
MLEKEREGNFKVVTKRAIQASEEEISKNKPSRSAKLRVLEKIS